MSKQNLFPAQFAMGAHKNENRDAAILNKNRSIIAGYVYAPHASKFSVESMIVQKRVKRVFLKQKISFLHLFLDLLWKFFISFLKTLLENHSHRVSRYVFAFFADEKVGDRLLPSL